MMGHSGLYCTNGLKCRREECTEQFQLCRHDSAYMQTKDDLYEENKRLRAEYAALQESVTAKDLLIASLKEQLQNVDVLASSLHHDKESLTQQLAAANGRGAELCKVARALDMAANHSVLEELPEVMREASKRIFAAVNGNGKTGAQMLDAALSDLPEADKEKS